MPGWPGGLGNRLQDGRAAVDQGLGDRLQAEPGLIDQWKASLANRILSAPSKLFGGLVADPAMDLATLAGDVIHGRQPTMAADPQTGEFHTDPRLIDRAMNAAGMLTLGAGAVPAEANSLRMGIRAYHGSPHDFERFDSSKIGTGEGAQAYGRGLYMAENEAVAKQYRDNLSQVPTHVLVDGESVGKYGEFGRDPLANAAAKVLHSMGDRGGSPTAENIKDAIEQFRSLNERSGMYSADDADAIEQAMQSLEGRYVDNQTKAAGKMYQVDIAADPEHFLDWDKPLSEQSPKVRTVLSRIDEEAAPAMSGEDFYRDMANMGSALGEDTTVASQRLREAGVPGIKYLDQGSRGKPQWTVDGEPLNWVDASVLNDYRVKGAASLEKAISEARDAGRDAHVTFLEGLRGKKLDDGGTRNFVIFPGNEHLISILKKYGMPISAAGLAALSQLHPQEAQAQPLGDRLQGR